MGCPYHTLGNAGNRAVERMEEEPEDGKERYEMLISGSDMALYP